MINGSRDNGGHVLELFACQHAKSGKGELYMIILGRCFSLYNVFYVDGYPG